MQGIKTGVFGEIVEGVEISEENRATCYETRREGIEVLQRICWNNYVRKGVDAVLFGVSCGADRYKYAVFVRSGFLRELNPE